MANWNNHDEESVRLLHAGPEATGHFTTEAIAGRSATYLYKAARDFELKFRLSWHWNVVAGDPYYALDCREDDYAWCNSSPDGELVPALHFEQLREGLDDYRRLATLARLAKKQPRTPAASAAEKLIADRLAGFRLGQRDHDALFGSADWSQHRRLVDDAIESLATPMK